MVPSMILRAQLRFCVQRGRCIFVGGEHVIGSPGLLQVMDHVIDEMRLDR